MVTLDDIAKEVGVSKVTVSNALRGKANVSKEMTARIMQVARSMHYRIGARSIAARNLKSTNEQTPGPIGIVVPAHSDAWTNDFIEYAVAALAQQQRQTIVQYIDVSAEFELEEFANQSADGLIISHPQLPEHILRQLILHRPTVCIDQLAAQRDADAVLTDSERGMQNGIEYLVSAGKRKIAILGGISTQEKHEQTATQLPAPFSTRLHTALNTLQTLGLSCDAGSIIPCEQTKHAASAAIAALGDNVMQYDAIACLTDEAAIGVLQGLRAVNCRVPQDVAVLGFGGVSMGEYLNPELSTVDTHINKVAQTAVQLLLDRLHDEDAWMPTTKTVPSEMRIRQTTQTV